MDQSDFYSFDQKKVSCLSSYLLLFHKLIKLISNWSFLSFKLFATEHKLIKIISNWFTKLFMFIEQTLSPTYVTEWTSTCYCKTSDMFFWLISLVSSQLSLTTLRFPHYLLRNTNLGKPSSFQCHLYQNDLVLPQLQQLFLKVCLFQWNRDFFFLKIKLEK